jgi:hypothetical protein
LLREFQALNGITDFEDDERPAHFRLWPLEDFEAGWQDVRYTATPADI